MKDMELKNKVLDEIMAMMKDKEVDGLKKKSPKFMAMSVEVEKPEAKMMEDKKEVMEPEEKMESEGEEELSDDMIKKLLEQLQD